MLLNKTKIFESIDENISSTLAIDSRRVLIDCLSSVHEYLDTEVDVAINNTYQEILARLDSTDERLIFTDIATGYRASMHKWIESNPMSKFREYIDDYAKETCDITKRDILILVGINSLSLLAAAFNWRTKVVILPSVIALGSIVAFPYILKKAKEKDVQRNIERRIKIIQLFRIEFKKNLENWLTRVEQVSNDFINNILKA